MSKRRGTRTLESRRLSRKKLAQYCAYAQSNTDRMPAEDSGSYTFTHAAQYLLLSARCLLCCWPYSPAAQITVSFPASVSAKPLDGRVLLLLSTDPSAEPRMQIDDSPRSQMVFGTTVDGLAPGQAVTITGGGARVIPIRSLNDVPPGDYYVQAVLNIYQTFHRADGTTVKLAPDRGEGQHWNLAPGNLYSKPAKVHIDGHTKLAVAAHAKPFRRSHPSRTRNTFATSASKASC